MRSMAIVLSSCVIVLSGCMQPAREGAVPGAAAPEQAPEVVARKPGPVAKVECRALLVDFDRDGVYEPYLVKGVGYQPTPIGEGPVIPEDPRVLERDFALLQEMHCNTIRTWGSVHRMLLDHAAEHGIKVIAGFKPYEDTFELGDPQNRADLIRQFTAYVAEYKDHPAILFWAIGNEDNYHYQGKDIRDWYTLANEMAKAAKEVEGDAAHPVAMVNGYLNNIGDPGKAADDASMTYIDLWGINVYLGRSFTNGPLGDFFKLYAVKSAKPLWASEYGIDAWDNINKRVHEEDQAQWVASSWDDLAASSICIGGTLMAYSDEWWKGGDPDRQDFGGYAIGPPGEAHPDGFSNEEWWGLVAVEKRPGDIDRIIPRKVCWTLRDRWAREYDLVAKYAGPDPLEQALAAVRARGIARVTASSTNPDSLGAWAAVDGDRTTRWDSAHEIDPSWLTTEFQEQRSLQGVRILWERASAAEYEVQWSRDGDLWTTATTITDGAQGEDRTIRFAPVEAKFVRIYGHRRASQWGYSIWEIEFNP